MRILITGFGPFMEHQDNPSQRLVESLSFPDLNIRKEIFKVDKQAILDSYEQILDEYQPDFILNIGLHGGSGALNLETFAIDSLKDKTDFSETKSALAYRTKTNTLELAENLCKAGIPAIRSDHAGNYYCNFILYLSLRWCKENGGDALFLHIPYTTEMAAEIARKEYKAHSNLPLRLMKDGVRLILDDQIGSIKEA